MPDLIWRSEISALRMATLASSQESPELHTGMSRLKSSVQNVKGEAERSAIATALEQCGWNRKAAARLLQVSYRSLLYKIEHYHMSPPESAAGGPRRARTVASVVEMNCSRELESASKSGSVR